MRAGLDAWHTKADGRLRDRLRVPPDHDRFRRGRRSKRWRSSSTRGSLASSCSWRSRRVLTRRRPGDARLPEGRGDRRADPHARRERHRHQRDHQRSCPAAGPLRAITASLPTICSRPRRPPGDRDRPGGGLARLHRAPSAARRWRGRAGPRRGVPAFAETCPQYLFQSLDDHGRPWGGSKVRMAARLRAQEHQAELWKGLRDDAGHLDRPLPVLHQGPEGAGTRRFLQDPERAPGVEHRMDLLHQGVVDGHISRRRWIELACATPARIFGLFPRKGTIASAPTRTSWSSIRPRRRSCRRRRIT